MTLEGAAPPPRPIDGQEARPGPGLVPNKAQTWGGCGERSQTFSVDPSYSVYVHTHSLIRYFFTALSLSRRAFRDFLLSNCASACV